MNLLQFAEKKKWTILFPGQFYEIVSEAEAIPDEDWHLYPDRPDGVMAGQFSVRPNADGFYVKYGELGATTEPGSFRGWCPVDGSSVVFRSDIHVRVEALLQRARQAAIAGQARKDLRSKIVLQLIKITNWQSNGEFYRGTSPKGAIVQVNHEKVLINDEVALAGRDQVSQVFNLASECVQKRRREEEATRLKKSKEAAAEVDPLKRFSDTL